MMKHPLSYWIVLTPVVLALYGSTDAWAIECEGCGTTVLGGPVVGETWTAANSPYCVTGDLFISNLTIEPGVCVRIDGPWRLNIQTIIHAEGTADQPIIFTAKDPGASRWKGMEFVQTVPGSVLRHCRFSYASDSAIRLVDTAPTIDHCLFENNTTTTSGGAIKVTGNVGDFLIADSDFVGNSATGSGGAIYTALESGVLDLQRCRFTSNVIPMSDTAGLGGAVYSDGNLVARECIFEANSLHLRRSFGADYIRFGGGIAALNGDVTLANCVVKDNHVQSDGGWGTYRARGGGVYVETENGAVALSNIIVGGNTLVAANEESGGGIYVASGDGTLTNVTIARNDRAGLHVAGGNVAVRNSIFWENNDSGDQIIGDVCVDYSTVQNEFAGKCGEHNIPFNPAFGGAGTTLCDLTIIGFSPCIDAGDPDPAFNDSGNCIGPPFGTERNDMGAHGGPGACWTYPSQSCPGDLNCDGVVNLVDLGILLADFGCTAPGPCPGDLDNDGDTDLADLGILLADFGCGGP